MSRPLLEYNEKIICESKSDKSALALFWAVLFTVAGGFILALPFIFGNMELAAAFIPGLFFFGIGIYSLMYYLKNFRTGGNTQLIITSERVLIYNKRQSDYNTIDFKDILDWQCRIPNASPESNHKGVFGKFTFNTTFKSTYVVNSISNYSEIYKALNKILPTVNYKNINNKKIDNKIVDNTLINMKTHFDDILKTEFSGYSIQENVSAETINSLSAGKGYRPYTYVLYKGGRAAATIMLTEHNRDNNKAFLGAKNMCLKTGIPFINFYTHFPNERNYVINRIRSFI